MPIGKKPSSGYQAGSGDICVNISGTGHNRAGRDNALKRLGIKDRRLNFAGAKRWAWAMAIRVTLNQALKTSKFNQAGLNLPWELAA